MTNPLYLTPAWRALSRAAQLRAHGLCEIRLPGCTIRATTADHIVELADLGAPLDLSNLQAACRHCNTAKRNKRAAERANRSVRRW